MGSYMEDSEIVLPVLRNEGMDRFGDLWNCQTSTPLKINIFEGNLTGEDLKCIPLKKLSNYKLTHVKSVKETSFGLNVGVDMKMEIFFGLITIRVGWGDFENTVTKTLDEELITCDYKLETFQVETVLAASSKINGRIAQELMEGNCKATHFLSKVVLGAEISSLFRLVKSKSSTLEESTGNFFGKMVTAPVGEILKALQSVLSGKGDEGPKTTVELNSIPEIKEKPSTVAEMFDFISKIEGFVEREKHFQMIKTHEVTGAPIRFVLVPIGRLFPDAKIIKLYKTIEASMLNSLMDMVLRLKDMSTPDFMKRSVCDRDSRLGVIFEDSENPFSQNVFSIEEDLSTRAKEFQNGATECLKLYKKGKKTTEDLQKLFEEFLTAFDNNLLQDEIEALISEGKKELGTIQMQSMKGSVVFLKSSKEKLKWLSTGGNMKLLLNSDVKQKGDVLSSLYRISLALKECGVDIAVEMPNVSSGFSLALRLKGKSSSGIEPSEEFGEDSAPFVLKTLAVAVDKAQPNVTRLYQGYADLLGMKFPLEKDNFEQVFQILRNLDWNLGLNGVTVTETVLEFRNAIWKSDNRLKFLLSIDCICTVSETVEMLRFARKTVKERNSDLFSNSDWIVGKFGLEGHSEAPVLFLFKNKRMKAICLDKIDVYILLDILFGKHWDRTMKTSPVNPKTVAQSTSLYFHPSKVNYSVHAMQMFDIDASASKPEEISSIDHQENKSVLNICQLSESVLSNDPFRILSTMASISLQNNPETLENFKKNGWNPHEKCFPTNIPDKEKWASTFKTSLEKFQVGESPFLTEIQGAALKLRKQLRNNAIDESDVDLMVKSILDKCDENEYPDLCAGIHCYKSSSGRNKVQGYLDTLEAQIRKTFAEDQKYYHLRSMTIILDKSFSKDYFKTKKNEYLSIIEQYLTKTVEHPSNIIQLNLERVKDFLKRGSIYQSLKLLAKCKVSEKLFILQSVLENFITPQLRDTNNLKEIIYKLTEEGFTTENFKHLWGTPKFIFLMNYGINDKGLLETINAKLCPCSQPPLYLPPDFIQALKRLLLDKEKITFEWKKEILELNDILLIFQEIAVRQLIPEDFQEILTAELNKHKNLKKDFLAVQQKSGMNFYWKDSEGYFEKPWDVDYVRNAIPWIMDYQNKKLIFLENIPTVHFTSQQLKENFQPNLISEKDILGVNVVSLHMLPPISNCKLCEFFQGYQSRKQIFFEKSSQIMDILIQMKQCRFALPLTIKTESETKIFHKYLENIQIMYYFPKERILRETVLISSQNNNIGIITLGNPSDFQTSTILNTFMINKFAFSEDRANGMIEMVELSKSTCSETFWNNINSSKTSFQNLPVLINIPGNVLLEENLKDFKELKKICSVFIVFLMPAKFEILQNRWERLKNALEFEDFFLFKFFVDPRRDCKHVGEENIFDTDNSNYESLTNILISALNSNPNNLNLTAKLNFEEFHSASTPESRKIADLVRKMAPSKAKNILSGILNVYSKNIDAQGLVQTFIKILQMPLKFRKISLRHLEIEFWNLLMKANIPLKQILLNNEGYTENPGMSKLVTKLQTKIKASTINLSHFMGAVEDLCRSKTGISNLNSKYEETLSEIFIFDGIDFELVRGDTWELQTSFCKTIDLRIFVVGIVNFDMDDKINSLNPGGITTRLINLDPTLKRAFEFEAILVIRACLSKYSLINQLRQILALILFHSHLTFITFGDDKENILADLLTNAFITCTLFGQSDNNLLSDIIFLCENSGNVFGNTHFGNIFANASQISKKWEIELGAQIRMKDKFSKVQTRIEKNQITKPCKSETCFLKEDKISDICTSELFKNVFECAGEHKSESFLQLSSWVRIFESNWDILRKNGRSKLIYCCKSLDDLEGKIKYNTDIRKTKNAIDSAFRFHRLRLEDYLNTLISKAKQEVEIASKEKEDEECQTATCSDGDCSQKSDAETEKDKVCDTTMEINVETEDIVVKHLNADNSNNHPINYPDDRLEEASQQIDIPEISGGNLLEKDSTQESQGEKVDIGSEKCISADDKINIQSEEGPNTTGFDPKSKEIEYEDHAKNTSQSQVLINIKSEEHLPKTISEEEPRITTPEKNSGAIVVQKESSKSIIEKKPSRIIPKEESSQSTPQEEPNTNIPKGEPHTNIPEEEPNTNIPEEEPNTNIPEEEPYRNIPEEEPYTNIPEEEPHTNIPKTEPHRNIPEQEPYRNIPEQEPYRNIPEEEPYRNIPEEEPYRNIPEKEPHRNIPEEEPKTNIPEEEPNTNIPEEAPQTNIPEEAPQTNIPEEEPNTNISEEELNTNTAELEPNINTREGESEKSTPEKSPNKITPEELPQTSPLQDSVNIDSEDKSSQAQSEKSALNKSSKEDIRLINPLSKSIEEKENMETISNQSCGGDQGNEKSKHGEEGEFSTSTSKPGIFKRGWQNLKEYLLPDSKENSVRQPPKLKRRHKHKKRIVQDEKEKDKEIFRKSEKMKYSGIIDWKIVLQNLSSDIRLIPFVCNSKLDIENGGLSEICHCAEALRLKQNFCSSLQYSDRANGEIEIDEYIKRLSFSTISKLKQMALSLELDQKLAKIEAAKLEGEDETELICKDLLECETLTSEEMLQRFFQHCSLKIFVVPPQRSLMLELMAEYGNSIAEIILSANREIFLMPNLKSKRKFLPLSEIEAFPTSNRRSSPYLTPNEIAFLKDQVSQVTRRIVTRRQSTYSSSTHSTSKMYLEDTYEWGTVRELKTSVEEIFKVLFPENCEEMSLDIKWRIHSMAIRKLTLIVSATHKIWESQYNPLQLARVKDLLVQTNTKIEDKNTAEEILALAEDLSPDLSNNETVAE